MEIPFQRWYPAIAVRQSRRQYDASKPISSDNLLALKNICSEFRPFPEARVELITETPQKIFNFILGSYGIIRNPTAALAFVGDMNKLHVQEAAGFTGEGAILEATALGIGTCWVAGFFRPSAVVQRLKLSAHERILAVSPLGYPPLESTLGEKILKGFAVNRKRKPLDELVTGLSEKEWPSWLKPALEAARIAPSATNRQPWRFLIETGSVTVVSESRMVDFKVSKRLDCGIAMLHLQISALNSGMHGRWEMQEEPSVARFIFQK
jgi:hypothetical protein